MITKLITILQELDLGDNDFYKFIPEHTKIISDNLIDEFVDLKDKIINEIHQLKDYRHIDVLYQRYVQYHSFELIAVNMGYTIRRVYQLHGDALQEFQKVLQFISVNNEL